jgi:hypothetical protein
MEAIVFLKQAKVVNKIMVLDVILLQDITVQHMMKSILKK